MSGLKVNIWKSTPGMHKWTEQFMIDIADDLKHTRSWGCEVCGKPSRETFWNVIHWTPVPKPTMLGGVSCQRGDLLRHKKVCKAVQEVRRTHSIGQFSGNMDGLDSPVDFTKKALLRKWPGPDRTGPSEIYDS
ncbi:hypothetical protein C8R44DRAFT_752245 [Mycena epipterygia]|nr:hypothetical protein C8R44DRAFT_752245 [Mycena epipterygia]